jgi:putative DeoR family transcriptional regulator (stage III sporulation protein D)
MGYYNSSPNQIKSRAVAEARYIIENEATIRETATAFGVSKSTVHRDIRKILAEEDRMLFGEVETIIKTNKAERHIRGGQATKLRCQRAKA